MLGPIVHKFPTAIYATSEAQTVNIGPRWFSRFPFAFRRVVQE